MFTCIKVHARAFRIILGEQGSPTFTNKMKKFFSNHLLKSLSLIREEVLDPEFQQYFQAFLSSAILGVIQEWMDKGNEELSVEEMVTIHFRLMRLFGNLVSLQQ